MFQISSVAYEIIIIYPKLINCFHLLLHLSVYGWNTFGERYLPADWYVRYTRSQFLGAVYISCGMIHFRNIDLFVVLLFPTIVCNYMAYKSAAKLIAVFFVAVIQINVRKAKEKTSPPISTYGGGGEYAV